MIKKTKILKAVTLLWMSTIIFACSNPAQQEVSETNMIDEDTASIPEMAAITYTLPSPLEIASIFKKSGMPYQEGLTSQRKNPAEYMTNLGKAINLGVYSADLSYALLNKQNQIAMEYMKLSRQIAGFLGMGSVYEVNDIAKRFEKNIGTEDSLTVIISELQMEMDFYLDENNQQQITAIAFAGAWIESMYIAAAVNGKSKEKTLNKKLSQQMSILESIINALKAGEKKDPAITKLIASIQPVKDKYEGFPVVKSSREKDDLGEKIVLTDEEIAVLSKEITALRSKFINGEF